MKIVILDGFTAVRDDLNWSALQELGEVTAYDRTAPEETFDRSKDAEIILSNKTVLTADIIDRLPMLKYIGILATGYNMVDLDAARRHGIVVTNIPAYSTMSVAQLAMSHLLNVVCRTDYYASQNRDGRWCREKDVCYLDHRLTELAGKQMAIIGLGNIGSTMAQMAQAFGINVVAVTSKAAGHLPSGIRKMELSEALATSHIISLHCPLTDGTRHLINSETIATMRPDAIVINTSRGPLVDDEAMAKALHDNVIAAYCTDVIAEEPPRSGNPLFAEPHAYVTPHIGWASHEARTRLVEIATENVRAFINGAPQNTII